MRLITHFDKTNNHQAKHAEGTLINNTWYIEKVWKVDMPFNAAGTTIQPGRCNEELRKWLKKNKMIPITNKWGLKIIMEDIDDDNVSRDIFCCRGINKTRFYFYFKDFESMKFHNIKINVDEAKWGER
jgi:hypothetical protein